MLAPFASWACPGSGTGEVREKPTSGVLQFKGTFRVAYLRKVYGHLTLLPGGVGGTSDAPSRRTVAIGGASVCMPRECFIRIPSICSNPSLIHGNTRQRLLISLRMKPPKVMGDEEGVQGRRLLNLADSRAACEMGARRLVDGVSCSYDGHQKVMRRGTGVCVCARARLRIIRTLHEI